MATLTKTETYPVPVEKFYQVITDYQSYPEYMDGVDGVRILEESEQGALVEYSLHIVKKFTYQLHLSHSPPHRIAWVLHSGDLFKKNSGYWHLEGIGEGQTRVTYSVDIDFKLMVPKIIINKVIKNNLPGLFANVYHRAEAL